MGNIITETSSIGNNDFLKVRPSQLTGTAKWKDIEDLINRWAKRNKRGALEQEKWLREDKETLFDKKNAKWVQSFSGEHAKVDPETKYSTVIHPELMNYIQVFYPNFLDTKEELHEFMSRFPKFRVRRVL